MMQQIFGGVWRVSKHTDLAMVPRSFSVEVKLISIKVPVGIWPIKKINNCLCLAFKQRFSTVQRTVDFCRNSG